VLVALGELLHVEQLPPGHDQIANAQADGGPAGGAHDNLEQRTRHVVLPGDQDVGHEGAHDGDRQLPAGIDRDDPARLTPARGREPIPDSRLRKARELPGRAAAWIASLPVLVAQCADRRLFACSRGYWSAAREVRLSFLTGLRWLAATRVSFSGGLWTRQLSARCPAQHAVDHRINGEAKPFVDISRDQLSGVGSN
jgi:hypothetical protein